MRKEREVKKVKIGKNGSIDENIAKLQRELDEALAAVKGAPRIKEETADEKTDSPAAKEVSKPSVQEKNIRKTYTPSYPKVYQTGTEGAFNPFKSSKFYITVFGILAFGIILLKTPVFRYTTPFRQDSDLPQIEVGFKYYNNLFGKQTKAETVIHIGKEKFTVRIPMSEWINMSKDKKLVVIKYIQK